MKILHTSDWHIGRTFHGHPTTEHLSTVLNQLATEVEAHGIDVVLVSGDVFDSSAPAAASFDLLATAIRRIRDAGAQVILTSGNHDSPSRLGFQSEWAALGGVHVITQHQQSISPIVIGDVNFYGIPYLEPFLMKDAFPGELLTTHEQLLGFIVDQIRDDMSERSGASVVLSHCFAAGVKPTDVERDVSVGGLGIVSTSVFDGIDCVALGHIHGRAVLADNVRYSGAPLYYSFKESAKRRGGWIVEIDAGGLSEVTWLDLPIPRRVTTLTDKIEELLTSTKYAEFENDWVSAVLTDQVRPMDAMSRLHTRFPNCATLEFTPAEVNPAANETYGARVIGRSDDQVVDGFLEFTRNGHGATEIESKIVSESLAQVMAEELPR